jgi:membrane protease YdiL (CAAX protease family)
MKGLLAHFSPLSQLLTLVGIALFSATMISLLGMAVLQIITGISITSMEDLTPAQLAKPGMLNFLRGMQLIQFFSVFLIPCWVGARLFSQEPNRLLGFQLPNIPAFWFWGILIMVISLPFIQLVGELNQRIPFSGGLKEWMDEKENSANQIVKALVSSKSTTDLLLNIFFVAVLAGVGEELLFRGLIQRLLARKFGQWAGILIAAALFSAMHMQFYGFFPRMLLGIVLGILFAYSGSLWVPMLAHFAYDALLITAAHLNPALLNDKSPIPMTQLILPALISVLLSLLLIRYLIVRSAKFPPMEPTYVHEDPHNPFRS